MRTFKGAACLIVCLAAVLWKQGNASGFRDMWYLKAVLSCKHRPPRRVLRRGCGNRCGKAGCLGSHGLRT